MKRLLCIVNTLDAGGAETFLMKIHRNLDIDKYQMDFCVMNHTKGIYEDEVLSRGGRVFHAEQKSKKPIRCFMDIRRVVRENKYSYVMRVNENSLSVIDLIAAKAGGAKVLAMRSSNAGSLSNIGNLLHRLFSFLPKHVPTVKLAPSTEAAEYTFGKGSVARGEVSLLHNGLDYDAYKFNPESRHSLREELGLNKCLTVGHVGRFSMQKNHTFLIDVFNNICDKRSDARLVLVGIGELESDIRDKVKTLGIEDKVIFAGRRSDVAQLMSAFDVMLFPSFHEGMPNVIIEAQAAGLPCVIADTITAEADITGLVKYMPLGASVSEWSDMVLKKVTVGKRTDTYSDFYNEGYDLCSVTDKFIRLIFEGETK